jgi:hypothetical protein
MIASKFLQDRAAILLGADTLGLGAAGFLNVRLSKASVALSVNTVLTDFTEATFTGYTAIITTAAGAVVTHDPLTGDEWLVVPPPAGGWIWTCTAAPSPAQTIYSVYVQLAAAGLNYLGAALLPIPNPIINAAGQSVVVDNLVFRMANGFMS